MQTCDSGLESVRLWPSGDSISGTTSEDAMPGAPAVGAAGVAVASAATIGT